MQRLCVRRGSDRQHLALAAGSVAALALALHAGAPFWMAAAITSLGLSWSLIGAGLEAVQGLRAELGLRIALACASPWLFLGILSGVRALAPPVALGIAVPTAALLQQPVRVSDIVGRTDGEEFCMLMPGTAAAAVHDTAERIRRAVKVTVVDAGLGSVRVSCSIGVAWSADARVPLDPLSARAAAAMYRAKAAGRDRVEPEPVTWAS